MTKLRAARALELAKNASYWDSKRVPKIDKVVMLPMPEANARTAALLSGQVDWIEAPAPDAVAQIKAAASRSTPTRSRTCGRGSCRSPRLAVAGQARAPGRQPVREPRRPEDAAGRLMAEAKGIVEAGHPWWGNPKFDIKYDPLPRAS
jgi:hypothetical protein